LILLRHLGGNGLDFPNTGQNSEQFSNSITSINRVGYDFQLGKFFNQIDFNRINDDFFKEPVLSRVAFPKSKLKTTEFFIGISKLIGVNTSYTGI